jgi:uncharacterized membrane protein
MLRFRGHPIHTAIIHFPIACYVLSLLTDICATSFDLIQPAVFSYYLLILGTITGALALCTGFIDLIGIKDQNAMKVALWHGGLNFVWFVVFGCFVLVSIKNYPNLPRPTVPQIMVKSVCVAGLFISNYLGGQLILKHKVIRETKHQTITKNMEK